MPRSALQGQMAISEQPESMLDSHHVMQSSLFPSSDVFQPTPGRHLTLTCVQPGSLPTVWREAQHPAGCNPSMNPALSLSPTCCTPPASITVGSHTSSNLILLSIQKTHSCFTVQHRPLPPILTSMGIPPQVP